MNSKARDANGSNGPGKPDLSSLAGLLVAMAGILGGLLLEGGKFSDVGQFTAALIVLGGTLGAVMVTTPLPLLREAVKKLTHVFWDATPSSGSAIDQLLMFATRARQNGLVSLEQEIESIGDPFLRKALALAVDGTDLQDLRRIMDLELELAERRGEAEARVFEAAGGYAPTIGIIGAVLGLIQVMKHLDDIEAVGKGIAVAFVATVYGVGLANVFLLPTANKLKLRLQQSLQIKELMLEGVISIAEGLNPRLIRSKLEAFQQNEPVNESERAITNIDTVRKARAAQGR
jgi:chemotaxis protein MotA